MIPMDVTVVAIVTTELQQPVPAEDVHTKPNNGIVIMKVVVVVVVVVVIVVIVVLVVVPVGLEVGCDDGCGGTKLPASSSR